MASEEMYKIWIIQSFITTNNRNVNEPSDRNDVVVVLAIQNSSVRVYCMYKFPYYARPKLIGAQWLSQ